jgi:hypothetical protein
VRISIETDVFRSELHPILTVLPRKRGVGQEHERTTRPMTSVNLSRTLDHVPLGLVVCLRRASSELMKACRIRTAFDPSLYCRHCGTVTMISVDGLLAGDEAVQVEVLKSLFLWYVFWCREWRTHVQAGCSCHDGLGGVNNTWCWRASGSCV